MPTASGFGFYPGNYPTTTTRRKPPPEQLIRRNPQFRILDYDRSTTTTTAAAAAAAMRSTYKQSTPRRVNIENRASGNGDLYSLGGKTFGRRPTNYRDVAFGTRLERFPPLVRQAKLPNRAYTKTVNVSGVRRDVDYRQKYTPRRYESVSRHHSPLTDDRSYRRRSPSPDNDDSDLRPRVRIGPHDYTVQRRTEGFDDGFSTQRVSERRRPRREIQIIEETINGNDDFYQIQTPSPRRTTVSRRTQPVEYIDVEETPRVSVRSRPTTRTDVLYLNDNEPLPSSTDDVLYIDERTKRPIGDRRVTVVDDAPERTVRKSEVRYIDEPVVQRPKKRSEVVYIDEPVTQRSTKRSEVVYIDEPVVQRPTKRSEVLYIDEPVVERSTNRSEVRYVDEPVQLTAQRPEVYYVDGSGQQPVKQPDVVYVNGSQPQPVRRPEVVYVNEPQPQVVARPEVFYIDQPAQTVVRNPDVVYLDDPTRRIVQPPLQRVVQPAQVIVQQPQPVIVQQPAQRIVQQTGPTYVQGAPEPPTGRPELYHLGQSNAVPAADPNVVYVQGPTYRPPEPHYTQVNSNAQPHVVYI